jgi:ubiquitin-protein ligase
MSRAAHISTLSDFNPKIIKIDESMYSLKLPRTTITICLPENFPTKPPLISCSPKIDHPFFDSKGDLVNHPTLKSWTPSINTGALVSSICEEIKRFFDSVKLTDEQQATLDSLVEANKQIAMETLGFKETADKLVQDIETAYKMRDEEKSLRMKQNLANAKSEMEQKIQELAVTSQSLLESGDLLSIKKEFLNQRIEFHKQEMLLKALEASRNIS